MELFWNFKVGKQLTFLPISFLTRATPGSFLSTNLYASLCFYGFQGCLSIAHC